AWGIVAPELLAAELARGELLAYPIVEPPLTITAWFAFREERGFVPDARLLHLIDRLLDEHSAHCSCQRLERVCTLLNGAADEAPPQKSSASPQAAHAGRQLVEL